VLLFFLNTHELCRCFLISKRRVGTTRTFSFDMLYENESYRNRKRLSMITVIKEKML